MSMPIPLRCAKRLIALLALFAASGLVWSAPPSRALIRATQGFDYRLTSFVVNGQEQPLVAPPITLTIVSAGLLRGNTGVNLYFGEFSVDDQGSLTWSAPGFATTRMAGEETLMNRESLFLAALGATRTMHLAEGSIVFASGDGATRLVFEQISVAEALTGLYGKTLTLTRLVFESAESKLPAGSRVTLTLSADGRVSGNSGVNIYSGRYQLLPPGGITFPGPLITTKIAGPPDRMEVENKFLQSLAAIERVSVRGGSLTLRNDSGTTILEFSHPGK
jgi:heat shock protein HslJ